MSGLRKAKKYDWKDSNLALFGSDLEKNVKKDSAEGEPAWEGAGKNLGTQIWRIVKFKVTHWPKEDYGKFYNGDSYIVLHTYKEKPDSEELSYHIHFWIGKESTQDEYGTAAYKTVELDHFLNDKPVQHREVQGHESDLFKSYFDTFVVMKGGADSGFNSVTPEQYKTRMLIFTMNAKKIHLKEKKLKKENLSNDLIVFIDLGLTIYQWNGKEVKHRDKFNARRIAEDLKSERNGKAKIEVCDDQDVNDLSSTLQSIIPEGNPKKEKKKKEPTEKVLFRLSDDSGRITFDEVARGADVDKKALNTKDVFILETEGHCFVWCGAKASIDERRRSMEFAHVVNKKPTREDCTKPDTIAQKLSTFHVFTSKYI